MPLPKPPRRSDVARTGRRNQMDESAIGTPPLMLRGNEARVGGPVTAKKTSAAKGKKPALSVVARKSTAKPVELAKLFVLDTNVMMHDPVSLFRFEEHDVFIPMMTLEELDNNKKGMTDANRNARSVSRELDGLVKAASAEFKSGDGLPLNCTGHKEATGKLFFQTVELEAVMPAGLPSGKADNQILGVALALRKLHAGRDVVLVSKDINMRIKARALGLVCEDYFNDQTLVDGDLLHTGFLELPADFWETHSAGLESWTRGAAKFFRVAGRLVPAMLVNQFVYLAGPGGDQARDAFVAQVVERSGETAVIRTLKTDYSNPKNAVWGVNARNRQQNFGLNLLMDPDCDFITLTGVAGTGKTLMALAAALAQVIDDKRYSEVIVTRATVSMGEDIGFLPGSEEDKMGPWMGAVDDNLEALSKAVAERGDWGKASSNDVIRSKIKIKSMNFMRGRTFMDKFVIIDEAQNLTPKQMKALITRAGPGTKIVCMGNLAQIDTPYLTEGSSGLTYAVDRFMGWPHGGHVTLQRGERSRLADFASEKL
jgi:PhoH-like ATPase